MASTYDQYQEISVVVSERVATITLERPAQLNAVNAQMHRELADVFNHVDKDPDVFVIILTGRGGSFCAGGDLEWIEQMALDHDRFLACNDESRRMIFSIIDCSKPIIAKVSGMAVGLGATLALFSDIILASTDVKIGDPHVRIGLAAGDGGGIIWPQLVGYAKAKELLMLGDLISAEQALSIGLINHVVPLESLDNAVATIANRLARGASQAIRYTKSIINTPLRQIAETLMDKSLHLEALTSQSSDHAEAIRRLRNRHLSPSG